MSTLTHVLIPVKSIAAAIEFYSERLGFRLIFRDGQRYAALDAGSISLGLVSGEEDVTSGKLALSIKVEDVESSLVLAQTWGASIVQGTADGPHERRAIISDSDEHQIVLYSKI